MAAWTIDGLNRIGSAEELQLSSRRSDGTLRKPVTMWVVRDGSDLYVRSVNGRDSRWFRGTQTTHQGLIRAGGIEKSVRFADAAQEVADTLDAQYRGKYHRYAATIIDHITSPEAREAAIKLVPSQPNTQSSGMR